MMALTNKQALSTVDSSSWQCSKPTSVPIDFLISLLTTCHVSCRQAPEVFIGDYGLEADVWAAGMMMYQLLSNRFPWWSTMEELHTTTLEEVRIAFPSRSMLMHRGPLYNGIAHKDSLQLVLCHHQAAASISWSAHTWHMKPAVSSVVATHAFLHT